MLNHLTLEGYKNPKIHIKKAEGGQGATPE
jgi:hypothetical protein